MYKLFLQQEKIKFNCFRISCFHNATWRAYENKLKTAYEHIVSCSHKCLRHEIRWNKSIQTSFIQTHYPHRFSHN